MLKLLDYVIQLWFWEWVWGDGECWFLSFDFLCSKHRESFLFKSVLIAKSEGNCCIITMCQRTWMCGLGVLDVKEIKQNFKTRWDWCAVPFRESGSEGWWGWGFRTKGCHHLCSNSDTLASSVLATCVVCFVLGLQHSGLGVSHVSDA